MHDKLEIRSYGGDAAPRLDGRTIDGYAIVFNQRSEVMLDWTPENGYRKFVEVIDPGAVDEDLLLSSDIKATVEHNRERLLARHNRGNGTLKLSIQDYGVRYEFESPKTQDGDFAIEMISRGDISGSSFAFSVKDKDAAWTKEGDLWVRTIKRFSGLYDVTITTDPAYSQTQVSVRSLADMDQKLVKPERGDPEPDNSYRVKLQLLRSKI